MLEQEGASFLKCCHVYGLLGQNAYILVIARSKATKQSRAGLQRDGLLRSQ
jgi:hypothetical protein